jgi:glutamate racemase
MQNSKDIKNPIGIFDSGIGGLTVAKTITELLPHENIIYFGDTAHTPWGDKSLAAIQAYSIKICDFLLERQCKCIVIACHTASSAAFDLVCEYVGDKARIVNVIDPVVQHVSAHHANKKIGLIGTKQTVRSNTYKKRLESLNLNIELSALATPLLVPLIEEGFLDKSVSELVVSEYLSHPNLVNIRALILGCTHYPLMKRYIQNYYQNQIDIIDASEITAITLKAELALHNILNLEGKSQRLFYVSDPSEFFRQATNLFFGDDIELQPYPLWG